MLKKRWTGARMSGVLAFATLLAVAVSGLAVAHASQKKAARKQQTVSSGVASVQAKGVSGKTAQSVPTLSSMLERSVEDLNAVSLPDGTQMVDLDGGFQNVTMATFDADGQLVLTCVDDLAAAEALLQSRRVPRATRGKAKESATKDASKRAPVVLEEK